MKRTDRLTNAVAIILFLAFLAYAGTYVYRTLSAATVTAEAMAAEYALSAVANGIVVREETVLTSSERYIDINVSEGSRVSAGMPIATAVNSPLGLERANRTHELEQEIARVSTALQELRSADDLSTREASMTVAARTLSMAVARHETRALDTAALNLEALLLGVDSDAVSAQRLSALQQELESLQNSNVSGAKELTAEVSGVFSTVVDGYEALSPADLQELTPGGVRTLIDSGRHSVSGAYGKLISDHRWYFAAVMDAVDAANLALGHTATLDFGRYYSGEISAVVQRVSPAEGGNVAVVFQCDSALADTLAMRTATANVIFGVYNGVRIPAQAVRTDPETETTYVWAVTAMQLERKDVEIIYTAGDFVIVHRDQDPGALREGNTVVVSGRDLFEGKVID